MQEQETLNTSAKADVVRKLLPLADNFERAAGSLKPATEGEEAVVQAYKGLAGQLASMLE